MHALLRHLEQVGFPASPRVVGGGYDDQGREVLTYLEGRIAHPRPYTDEQIWQVGRLLRNLHDATAGFGRHQGALWQPWSLRSRAPDAVISHCDAGPWHVIVREGRPVGLIDWSMAGPTDLEELAATGEVERTARLRRRPRPGQRLLTRPPAVGRGCGRSWTATASRPPTGRAW